MIYNDETKVLLTFDCIDPLFGGHLCLAEAKQKCSGDLFVFITNNGRYFLSCEYHAQGTIRANYAEYKG